MSETLIDTTESEAGRGGGGFRFVADAAAVISSLAIFVMLFIVLANVFVRAGSGNAFPAVFEMTEALVVVATFAGLSQAEYLGSHIKVELLTDRLRPVARGRVRWVGRVGAAIFVTWVAIECTERAWKSTQIGEFQQGLANWPIWPTRIILAAGLWLSVIVTVGAVITALRRRREKVSALSAPKKKLEN